MKKLFIIALLIVSGFAMLGNSEKEYKDVAITINSGDTLWSIAEEHIGRGEVMDEVLWRIKEKNPGINPGSLQPGTQITIPVLVEK